MIMKIVLCEDDMLMKNKSNVADIEEAKKIKGKLIKKNSFYISFITPIGKKLYFFKEVYKYNNEYYVVTKEKRYNEIKNNKENLYAYSKYIAPTNPTSPSIF